MNNKMREALRNAFEAPQPERKREFLAKMRPRKVSTARMLLTQASYIRKSVWILSVFILLITIIGISRSPDRVVQFLGAVTPFAAAIGVLETYRSYNYQMSELEQATRFSLRSVIYARMLMIGVVNLAVIFLSATVLAARFETSLFLMASKIIIPYLITMSAGLHIERTAFGRNNAYISVAVAAVISFLVLWADAAGLSFLALLSGGWVMTMAAGLFAITIWEVFRTIRFTEAYA